MVAAGAAARLTRMLGGRLGLIHVLDVPPLNFWVGVEARMKEDIRTQAEATLLQIAERVEAVCSVVPEYFIVEGLPEVEIRLVVEADPAIVMVVAGRHGVGTERRAGLTLGRSLGRLSEKLAADLSVPVLIVPPEGGSSDVCPDLRDLVASRQPGTP
jgi:nucleotide-binding universal stress UspA family protein